jgi:hypothetical protein
VTTQLSTTLIRSTRTRRGQEDTHRITNTSTTAVDTHLLLIAQGLGSNRLENASGISSAGAPYRRLFLTDGLLLPGQSIDTTLRFQRRVASRYTLSFLSGQGNP